MCDSDANLVEAVRDAYSAKARTTVDSSYAQNVASAFGYSVEELQAIPAEANLGLSCGNPVGAASIKEGEKVLDLGSGGGIDIFLAASKVGPTGQAIGLDMSEDMITLARKNAAKKGLKPPHVAFVQAALTETFPIASDSIDCILSNCVLNLVPGIGKAKVMKEVFRVLKPGGRIVLDDIIAKKPLPACIRNDLVAYVGCISGAVTLDDYKVLLSDAGFKDPLFVDTKVDLNVYFQPESGCGISCCAAPPTGVLQRPAMPNFDANEWVGSYQIYAVKASAEQTADVQSVNPLNNWWDAYPRPKSDAPLVTAEEVVEMMKDPVQKDFAVIDVRRNDHGGGHVRGSTQCPAQTFYDDLPTFVEKFGNTKKVIFYCGSSNGRGPRCARWYQDRLNELGNSASAAYVLKDGIRGWLAKYGDATDLVDRD
ncbi:hypothetical protein JAAARDRAFT_131028 [Jaapia argillacea MUCL 33604]|uniref:Arsenite methyltransferase n=1 Tax=Jaapia argillacea MUCL 33604 TaxID=933084 RepID=A0A067Q311_9AGAM|nr:hypothetical protein JAAARDRAFT_131028 [Jaapia argillacea MUCL 33604]